MSSIFSWSSGKDSALALYKMQQQNNLPKHLITTINTALNRVTMHGTRTQLLLKQLKAIDIPFSFIELPEEPTMEEYETIVQTKLNELKKYGFNRIVYGDIFLEDLKTYRQNKNLELGFESEFPLWKNNTTTLIEQFFDFGFKAIIVSCSEQLGKDYVGEELSPELIKSLPNNIDPCGENGEFHTFCYDGPIFKRAIPFKKGEKIKKTYKVNNQTQGFWFCDLH